MPPRRRKKLAGVKIKVKSCKSCPPGTGIRPMPAQIICIRCGAVLKQWEPPVIWIDGEPVPISFP